MKVSLIVTHCHLAQDRAVFGQSMGLERPMWYMDQDNEGEFYCDSLSFSPREGSIWFRETNVVYMYRVVIKHSNFTTQ